MTNTILDLDKDVEETFEFILNKTHYIAKYPTTEELDKILAEPDVSKITDKMYKLIEPKDKNDLSIENQMKKSNVLAAKAFISMLKDRFLING